MDDSQSFSHESRVELLVHHVCRKINIQDAELSDEFFPAHLSIALIDAILTPRLHYYKVVVPIIARYCERFNLRRTRSDRTKLPPVDKQETLSNLVGHYETLSPNGFQDEIVRARFCSPGTRILKSDTIKRAAMELRKIEIETLQDIQYRTADEVKCVLRSLPGVGDRTIHMFLMYVGRDEYVKGDVHVIRFVREALNKRQILAAEAERLVQRAATKLGITPRLLDYEIWKYGSESK